MITARLLANPISIYLALAAAGLLLGALTLLVARIRLVLGERAMGQVVGYKERLRAHVGDKRQYMPLVRFQPHGGGEPIEFQSRLGASSKPFEIGEPVSILYRPGKPQAAEIATSARLWLAPTALAAMAFVTFYGAWKAGAPH